ncbi:MAG: PAS domain-containing protein [Planctomycetes bacterium]|nr:PAS domain-containing protein [Planctomycetota bacterium]
MRQRTRILFMGLALVLGALAAFQVGHALFWLENLRRGQRREILAEVTRGHGELVQNLRGLYDAGRQHVRSLSRLPEVGRFMASALDGDASGRNRLDATTLPYLLSFDHLDRLTLIDAEGREVYRCERMGGGAGSLPESRLGHVDLELFRGLVADLSKSVVATSALRTEGERVEVRESSREVLYYATRVRTADERWGVAMLTVYASPLLSAVRAFEPLPGSHSALRDNAGLHWLEQEGDVPTADDEALRARLAERSVDASAAVESAEFAEGLVWTGAVAESPRVELITVVSNDAIDARTSPWQRGGAMVVVSMAAAIALVGIVFFAVLVLSRRAWRQQESERFLALTRAETERLRALIDNSADLIVVLDPSTCAIREANRAMRVSLGLDLQEASRTLDQLIDRSAHEPLFAAIDQARRDVGSPVATGSFALRLREGGEVTVDGRCVALEFETGPLLLVALRDRTDEREVERQLLIGDRLSSLGFLTSGVAHEINNPLEGIGNYLALLSRPDLPPEKRTRYLEQIRYGFDRIRDLVRDLLAFGRTDPRIATTDLRQVIDRAVRLTRVAGKFREVEVVPVGLDEPIEVAADAGRLEQVFLNLLINAANAMEGSGRVTIRATTSADRVILQIEDTGPGFPEDVIHRVFDPFFTTRDGSGLGLSVAYGIVEAHGGTLTAGNRSEGGARLTLTLPAASPQPQES